MSAFYDSAGVRWAPVPTFPWYVSRAAAEHVIASTANPLLRAVQERPAGWGIDGLPRFAIYARQEDYYDRIARSVAREDDLIRLARFGECPGPCAV